MNLLDFYKMIGPVCTGYDLIRIGGASDGSYLVPNVLDGISLCVSPGTCGVVKFETHLAESYGIPSLLCDPEEDTPPNLHPLIKFDRLALGPIDGPKTTSLATWLKHHDRLDSHPILLSMDIEGAEVQIINEMELGLLASIRIATIEFHYLHALHFPEHQIYAEALIQSITRMTSLFDIVHFKPNNNCPFQLIGEHKSQFTIYSCIELTFLSKQLRRHAPIPASTALIPHPLDHSNVDTKPPANYEFYIKNALTM